MKYHLVAVLDKESNKELETYQKPLFKKGRKFNKPPYMSILLDTIEDPDKEKLEVFLNDLLKPFYNFHIEFEGNYINDSENKLTGVTIKNFGYIKKVRRHLNEYMELSGYKVAPEMKDTDKFILSMSTEKLPRELENKNISSSLEGDRKYLVEKIELWKTMGAKKDSIVFSIPLKNPRIL